MDNRDREQSEGMIYTNDYRQNDKQPNWTGSLVLQKPLVRELVEKIKNGEEAILRVALWDRISKNNKEYKFARLDVQQKKKDRSAPPPKPEPVVEDFSDDDIPF